jgi:tetratricopeptide (TPR) repeat protein
VLQARGDVDGARARAEHALELAEEAKFRPVIADAVHHLARILLAVGDIGAARRRLLEAVDARVILRDGRGKAVALQELAALETALGDHAAALVCLRDAAAVYLDAGMHGARVDVLGVIASLEERSGNLSAAVDAGAEAVRAAYQVGPDAAFRALLGHAERLTGLGELGAAADALGSIVDLPGVEPAQRATGLAMRGQVLFALGHEGPAVAALVAARDLFLPLDAAAAAEVDEILAELSPTPH